MTLSVYLKPRESHLYDLMKERANIAFSGECSPLIVQAIKEYLSKEVVLPALLGEDGEILSNEGKGGK